MENQKGEFVISPQHKLLTVSQSDKLKAGLLAIQANPAYAFHLPTLNPNSARTRAYQIAKQMGLKVSITQQSNSILVKGKVDFVQYAKAQLEQFKDNYTVLTKDGEVMPTEFLVALGEVSIKAKVQAGLLVIVPWKEGYPKHSETFPNLIES